MSSSQEVEAAMTKEPSTEQQIVSCGKAGLRVVAAVVPAAVTGALALLRAGRPRSLSACLLACAFILLRLIMRLFSSDSFVYFSFFCVCVWLFVCLLMRVQLSLLHLLLCLLPLPLFVSARVFPLRVLTSGHLGSWAFVGLIYSAFLLIYL